MMLQHVLVCRCGEVLVKSIGETTKLRCKIVIFRDDQAMAVCKGCGAELPVPVKLDKLDLYKSQNPRLFLHKMGSK